MNPDFKPSFGGQKGMATLLTTLCLALIISLGVFAANSSALDGIKAANSDYWTRQAIDAAQKGTASGIALLADEVPWSKADNDGMQESKTKASVLDEYSLEITLKYNPQARAKAGAGVVTVLARAEKEDGTRAFAEEKVLKPYYLNPAFKSEPLVLTGTISSISGHLQVGKNKEGVSAAIGYSEEKLPPEGLGFEGSVQKNSVSNAWDYVFGIDKTYAKFLATAPKKTGVWWFDATNPAPAEWSQSVGKSGPEIVVIAKGAGCPSFADGVEINGVLFIEEDCPNLKLNKAKLSGTLVLAGETSMITSEYIEIKSVVLNEKDFKMKLPAISILGSRKVS